MKNKIKGLLALVLSVLIGQAWATDPVATWTDFNTLTSGNYTITKDAACTVNTDGSITLGGTGLTLPVSGNQVTVVMEVSGVPTESGITVVSVKMGGQYVSLKSNGTQLVQSWNNGGNYGTFDWTPAKRQTIVLGTMQSNPSGTTTWIDGEQKAANGGLMTTKGSLQNVYIGAYDGTTTGSAAGMTVHSLRIYSSKLSAAEVYAASYRSVISYCVNNTTSNDNLSGLAIGEDAVTRVKNKHWNNINCPTSGQSETANSYALSSAQDNNGKIWPIGVSGTAGGQWWHDQTGSLGAKGNNYADGPWVMNFKDIPFTKYDVVLYMATDSQSQKWGAIQVGETNPTYYVPDSTDPTVATSTDVTASTQWGQTTPATAAYGTNVIRITDLTEKDLYLKALKNTRGGLHGFQIINRGEIRKIKADAGTTVTYTADTEIAVEVSGTGTLSADGCTLDVTKATMKGCALAAQNNGVIVLKADQLDTIGGLTIPQGATVKIITDSTDAVIIGKAVFAVPANTTIAGTVTLVTLDGEKEATAEIVEGILTAEFTANPAVTGTAWWWDYEFTGNATSIGSDKGGMTLEKTEWTQYTEADGEGNRALYFQQTPWRDAAFTSQDAFTAVMYCQPGEYNEVPLVGFGSTTAGDDNAVAIVLATGKNAANGEMAILLVKGSGHVVTSLADNLIVPNATTTNHLYAFTFEAQADKTVISVYVDGKLKKTTTVNERFHVTDGFQIGSIHGGVMNAQTGLKKYTDGATEELAGTIDFLRVAKGVLSVDAMKALAKEYLYVSENGIAQRTIADATATWVADAAWTQKSAGADVQQRAPNAGTNVALTIDAETEVTVNLDSDTTYETMTIDGTEAVTLKKGESKILAGDLTISTDTTIEYGAIEVGTVVIDAGKTLTFDFSAYDFASVWADRTISLTGLATVADGAEVTATIPETLPVQIQSATFAYNGETQEYALVIDIEEGELTGTIAPEGDWDSITWKMGEVEVTPTDFTAMTAVNLIVPADATLTMNKAVTVKNLTISGEGALTIAKEGSNKLIVSGATTINAHVTATASAAALGSITINEDKSLTVKERIANVGTITSNAGELVYMGGNITEDKQLTNAIGAIRIATGMVNFTKANGDYTSGAITIDNGATMKVSDINHNPFGRSPITNNGAIVSTGVDAHLYPVVSGTGTLTVESGTLTLHGANTYQGGTTVKGGTLVVSGAEAGAKVLPEGKTVAVNENATIKLVAGLSFVTIEGEGKTLVTGTYTYGIAGAKGVASDLTTKTVEVAEGGVLQFRAWRAYALTIDTLIVNGTLKNEGYDGAAVPTVTVAQGQKLSGTGTIELAVTLADGALVGNAEVVPATAVVQGSVTCDAAEIATALAGKLTPPTGYHFNVTDKVLSIALNKVNVTIPAAPANTKWYDAEGNVVDAGTIAVDPNTDVTLTLKADDGKVFADGSTSKDYTVNSGENGAEIATPDVTAATPVAIVNGTKYQTLDAAIAAAGAGDEVMLIADIELTTFVTITKSIALNLNDYSINRADGTALYVNDDKVEVTIRGVGSVSGAQAVYVGAGTVAIENGNFHGYNGGHAVYVQGTGKVEIIDGTFSIDEAADSPNYVLNKYDADRETTSIVVMGGKFEGFNPANNGAEGPNTNFCAEGYEATLGDDGYWTVALIPVSDNVAKIEISETEYTEYKTLELAFDAAANMTAPVTVTLLKDVGSEEEAAPVVSIPQGFNGTLDLDGKTLYSRIEAPKAMVALTIKNGKILHRTGSAAAIDIKVSGLLTLDDVYLETSYHGVRLRKNAKGVINSGDYRLVATSSSSSYNLLYLSDAPASGDSASLVINGGDFYSRYMGTPYVMIRALIGEVVINDGVFHAILPGTTSQTWCIASETGRPIYINGGDFSEFSKERIFKTGQNASVKEVYYTGGMFSFDPVADATADLHLGQMEAGYHAVMLEGDDFYTVVEKPAIQLTIDLGDGVSKVDYTIAGNTTTITEDTTIDIAESGTVVSFAVVADDGYFAPTVADVTVTETTTVPIAGVAFSAVESADAAITADNRDAVYAWAKSNGKSQSEVSAANYLYADYLFNFTKFSAAEPTIEITEFTVDPLVIKAKVTVGGETKIADLSATGLNLNGTLKYKAAPTLEALEDATPKAALDATDRFFKVVVE